MLLAALWLSGSSHALLEYFELIHQVHAKHDSDSGHSHEHNADNHPVADGNCAVSSTQVSVSPPEAGAMPVFFAPGLNWASELHLEPPPSGLAPPGGFPPLPNTWQFVHRASLPVRAPSSAS